MSKIATEATSYVIDKFERQISEKGVVRARKGLTLSISIEDMDDIVKIVESLQNLRVWIDGATESVKHKIKKQEVDFLGPLWHPWLSLW